MGAEFHANRGTDMAKLVVAFRNSANALKINNNNRNVYIGLEFYRTGKQSSCVPP